MRTLVYADWCTLRPTLRQYLAVGGLICAMFCIGGIQDESDAVSVAAYIQQTMVTVCGMMLTMMCFYGLFGADEREGWESQRLSLPVSRNDVVRSRYVVLLLLLCGLIVGGAAVGVAVGAVAAAVAYGTPVVAVDPETLLVMAGSLTVVLFFSALEMPIFFWKGVSKARAAFMLPLLLVPLLSMPGVREHMEALALSPWQIIAVGLPVSVVALAVSVWVSERAYAARDFS